MCVCVWEDSDAPVELQKKMQEMFNKDLEELKNKHLEELKNKQTEMNNTVDRKSTRLNSSH